MPLCLRRPCCASVTVHHKVSPQALLASPATEVYAEPWLARHRAPYYPVSAVSLSQPQPGSSAARGYLALSFATSCGQASQSGRRQRRPGKPISPLTLVLRRTRSGGGAATTELTDTFSKAVVASLVESLSAVPSGNVSLLVSAVGRVVTSPSAVRRVGPFAATAAAPTSSAATTAEYVKLGPPRQRGHATTA